MDETARLMVANAQTCGEYMASYAEETKTEKAALDDGTFHERIRAEQAIALRGLLFYGFAAICATLRGDYVPPSPPPSTGA